MKFVNKNNLIEKYILVKYSYKKSEKLLIGIVLEVVEENKLRPKKLHLDFQLSMM